MTTLESLLNEIVQDVDSAMTLLHETLQNLDNHTRAGKGEDSKDAIRNCLKEISKKYSDKLIDAVKLANSVGSDTNPIYLGEIENYKGTSLLHYIAVGFWPDDAYEILRYIRPEDIKRGSTGSELMGAIENLNTTPRDWLIENDLDVMYQKASGSSALHIACMVGDYETTERLIHRVAKEKGPHAAKEFVNAVNNYGCTPLYDALVMGSSRGTLDNDKMMKFLSLFIENGVDLSRENSGNDTDKYTIFNKIVTSHILQELDLDRASAVVKMLNSGQDVTIDLKDTGLREFFTNEANIQKMFLSEGYDAPQKSLALNKIKEALTGFDNQNHTIPQAQLESSIHLIDQQIIELAEANSTENDIEASEVASGIA